MFPINYHFHYIFIVTSIVFILLVLLILFLWSHFRQQIEKQRKINIIAILEAQENERKDIAKEVHDNLGPILSISALQVDVLSANIIDEKEALLLQNIKAQLSKAVLICRQVSHELTPVMHSGISLNEMISSYTQQINETGKLSIKADISTGAINLNEQKATSLCRIATELLHNTLKHAEATEAWINIYLKGKFLFFEYRDNGIGLAAGKKKKGIGLSNIYSRVSLLNGTVSLTQSPSNKGFFIYLKIPQASLL